MVRLAEAVAALSPAIDVGMGQPMEQDLRTCLVASRLGERVGLGTADRQRVYYLALLRHLGCTADNQVYASLLGDERAFRREALTMDFSKASALLPVMLRQVGAGQPPLERIRTVGRLLAHGREFMNSSAAVCEVAQLLAVGLGIDDPGIGADLGQAYERWDGRVFRSECAGPTWRCRCG